MLKILLYIDAYQDRIYQNAAYVDYMSNFGEVILVSTMSNLEYWVKEGDVLCIPGGADVDPSRYGEKPQWTKDSSRINQNLEYLDKALLGEWLKTKKPIIGICRGMQTLNVALGGTLHQHVIGHAQHYERDVTKHILYTDIQNDQVDFRVHLTNSIHHQAVKALGEGLEIIGWSPVIKNCPSAQAAKKGRSPYPRGMHRWDVDKKGNITRSTTSWYSLPEIVRHKTLPYLAFQYHPEEFNCELATYLINDLLGTDVVFEVESAEAEQV